MSSGISYDALLREAVMAMDQNQIPDSNIDAWYLMEEVFGLSRVRFLMDRYEEIADPEAVSRYRAMVTKRCDGWPVQQIIGRTEFMGLPFYVSEAVLTPRQDTEILVETALGKLSSEDKVLDMCTGSGCIILSLAKLGGLKEAAGADLSEDALEIAAKNRDHLGLTQVQLIHTDLFENINETYDMIVSNPPYIPSAQIETLMREVRDHEPRMALDGSDDGLHFYRCLARESGHFLKKGGYLIMEIGYDQAADVTQLLESEHFEDIQVVKDLAGLDRVVYGRTK